MRRALTAAEVGKIYDDLYRRRPFQDSARFYRWVTSLAGIGRGERVLDVGCGLGGALAACQSVGAEAWGVDLSRVALEGAARACPAARLFLADGARLPFPDRSFRHIFCLGNLEHFRDLGGGIRELRRVLREDGRAWLLLPNLCYSGTLWRVLGGGRGPDHHQPIDRFATRLEWQEILEAGGLRVLQIYPYHKGKWWKRLLPSTLAWHFLYQTCRGEPSGKPVPPPLTRMRFESHDAC